MNNDLLFVYGSLLDGDNEFGHYLIHNADVVGPALFKGRLYDCGEYPGAIADNDGYDIKGNIFSLHESTAALAVLDDYEGFGVDQEQPNLFVREQITATCNNQIVGCWIYLYNPPIVDLTEIPSGDYIDYLKA